VALLPINVCFLLKIENYCILFLYWAVIKVPSTESTLEAKQYTDTIQIQQKIKTQNKNTELVFPSLYCLREIKEKVKIKKKTGYKK